MSIEQLTTAALGRRKLLSGIGLGLGAFALAGCSGPSTDSSNSSSTSADPNGPDFNDVEPAKSITFWSNHPGGSEAVTKKIIEKFTASSGIEVKLVTAGSTYEDVAQKFQSAQAGGQLPDMVNLSDVWWFRYLLQDSIIPLGNVLKAAGVKTDDYRESLLADYQYKGSQWCVPWARSTPIFYYNKEHWKKAGLPDRAPSTWEEFDSWTSKLKSANTGAQHVYEYPALADYAGWTLQNVLWGFGGGWGSSENFDITCDSPESVKALKFVQDSVYSKGWAGVSSKESTDDLAAGACSATIGSAGSLVGVQKAAKFGVGVGNLPGGPAASTKICPTGGCGLGIVKKSDKAHQLAAAKFIGFLTNPRSTVDFSAVTGYMPVRKSADTSKLLKDDPLIGTAIKQLDVTKIQSYARVFLPGADQEMAKAVSKILTQKADVDATMKQLRTTLQKIYDSQVKPKLH